MWNSNSLTAWLLARSDHDTSDLRCKDSATVAGGIPPLARRLSLDTADRLVLTADLTAGDLPAAGQVARIGCTLPEAVTALRPGDPVLFDDGAITSVVESVAAGEATVRITGTKPAGSISVRRRASTCPTRSCR
jgi:pyruvate kinase